MSIRLAVARHDDADRSAVENAFGSGTAELSAQHRIAVELADALMSRPSDLTPELIEQARQHFTPNQLVELTLKVMKFNVQKVSVALGTDRTITAEQIGQLTWNSDGTFVIAD